jgi:hypothetical protein
VPLMRCGRRSDATRSDATRRVGAESDRATITECNTPGVHRHAFAARHELRGTESFWPVPPAEARPVDLASIRLVLRQHLAELRSRGADDAVLGPIEDELRRYGETVDELTRRFSGSPPALP